MVKINPNSKAYNEGIKVGDYVESINGQNTKGIEHQSAQQMIKNATDQLMLELTRESSKTNGTVNGEVHNHIDSQLDYLNSGKMRKPFAHNAPSEHYQGDQKPVGYNQGHGYLGIQGNHVPSNQAVSYHGNRKPGSSSVWTPNGDSRPTKTYKPVSFSHHQSPSHSSQNIPMMVTVNTNRVKSRTAPASPVFQRQYRTAPTSPVMFQSVLKIPPLSPRSAKRDPDTNDRDLYRGQQQTYGGVSASEKNVSADNSAWSLPIKIEAKKQNPDYNSQQSASHDSPRSYGSPRSQSFFPPPRDFASGHGELPREIPVVFKGISESIKGLRQVPVEVDQGQNPDLARSVNIERSPIQRALLREQFSSTDADGHQGQQSPGASVGSPRREIPIQIRRGPFSSQTSLESDSKPDSPRQIRIEHDKKKADLEKRRIDLERDINNVIYEAIKQVPIYDKQTKQEIKPNTIGKYPDIAPPPYGAQQSEYIIPTKVESQREKRVEEALQHQLQADKKKTFQKDWEEMQQDHSMSYATLPGKKSSTGDLRSRQMFEPDPGSYSTLPSFGHKVRRSGSPKLQRNIVHDDDVCFSDIEGGRGKAQPSWRPQHSPLLSRHVWKPNVQPTQVQNTPWAPTASPDQQRRDLSRAPMSRAPMSRSLSESQSYPTRQEEAIGLRQERRGFIPIQIQHEQKPRKVGEGSCDDERDSSLSSFDTIDSSDPKINGTQPPIKSSPKPGVWKPGIQHSSQAPSFTEKSQTEGNQSPSLKEIPQRWSPGGPSNTAHKGYRPIRTDFSRAPSNISAITAPESYTKSLAKSEESYSSWKPTQRVAPTNTESLPTSALSPPQPLSSSHQDASPVSNHHDKKPEILENGNSTVSPPPVHNGLDHHVSTSMLHLKDEPSHLPPSQSPYITLLQKNRDDEEVLYYTATGGRNEGQTKPQGQEGKIPKGAIYLGKSESMEGDVKHTDTYYAVPSEEKTTVTTTKVSSPKRYEDIGPIDEESGMPLSFRKNVEEDKQHDWYKQMYKSLHRTKKKEGTESATNNYKPTYQFPDDDDDTKSLDVTEPSSTSEPLTEESKSYFSLASPKSAFSPTSPSLSSKCSELSPSSPKLADISPQNSHLSPRGGEKTSPGSHHQFSHSAINDTSSAKLSSWSKSEKSEKTDKSEKSDKSKFSITSVSESLRRDAKFPSGKKDKSDEVFFEKSGSKSDDEQDVNPYRPSYDKPSRSVRGDINSGYLSEPEYRSKMRSKSTSNVSKTARALSDPCFTRDIGTLPTDLEEFIKYLDEWSPASARSTLEVYRNQPRSIVDYEPGFSSIAFRESKTQRSDRPKSYTGLSPAEREKEAKKRSRLFKRHKAGSHNPPPELPGQYSTYTEGKHSFITGKKLESSGSADDVDSYKKIQKGGEIPIKGLQKPAPEKSPKTIQSQTKSSNEPIKSSETYHQKLSKSQNNHLFSKPNTTHETNEKSVYRTNGSIPSSIIPNPPVRNPLRISIPSSKPSRSRPNRSSQSAAQQLGVKSPPPARINGVDEEINDSSAFRHLTTEELRSQQRPSDKDQRRREEEESYRKRRLEQIYEEERRKKILQQQADIASRKHSDFLFNPTNQQQVPSQKSPIPNDRFEYGTVPEDRRRGFKIQGKAKGLYNFTAHNSRELAFRKGDILYLIRQIDANWFEGERNGRIGIFPVNYVEVLTSIEEASTAARQSEGQARAKYTFNSQTSVELPLNKGDIVTLLRNVDDNWFEGRVGNRQGIFPVAYVEVLQEPSTPLITPAPSVITTPMTGRGTPEMLSPVSYDGAPTPPPQPSPGAFTMQSDNLGSRYATSPRDQHFSQQQDDSRLRSQRHENISPQRFEGVQSQRHYDNSLSSRHMNGGYSSPQQHSFSDFSARSQRSPQQIRKDNPPSLNITAKSVSTPNVSMTSKSRNFSKGTRQEEDLAIARYRAIYAYRPQNEDELELLEGDEIYVMEKCDDGWYVGTSGRTGMFGTFPGNYVTRSQ
ncbi:uncharacterized protein LOC132752021 isoform X6 [Ruditapes philippinarum]|uniref:uncharacterized protein LOC132752021 isoform X6 n=1 Tax=Ruditapes philippinarum TaxID=129788 RepID=UPI00295B7B32|nr:uncharacterized protein LOC132752021 isoform X6 [Ruditapes philippinarum]